MQLALDTKGLKLSVKDKVFFIETPSLSRKISPKKVTSIAITAFCTITSSAVILAVKNQIPILFFDRIGKAQARVWSPYFQSLADLRRRQIKFADTLECTIWFIELYKLKSEHLADNLFWLSQKFPAHKAALNYARKSIQKYNQEFEPLKSKILKECRQELMLIEAKIARQYWQALGKTLPPPYRFQQRSRRPAQDMFNAVLNYLYGMTYTIVEGGLFAAGLDPHLGFVHADEYNRPVLSFDLIEPFRPWIDRLLIAECLKKNILKKHFTANQHGLFLNKHGKALVIPMFNEFLHQNRNFLAYNTNNKNHIYQYAGLLARNIRTTEMN